MTWELTIEDEVSVKIDKFRVSLVAWASCACGYPHVESAVRVPDRPWWVLVQFLPCPQCGEDAFNAFDRILDLTS